MNPAEGAVMPRTKRSRSGRPTKEADQRKGRILQVRVDPGEKEAFDAAAELAGLGVSSWVRERLRTLARNELEAAGKSVAFL